jgi:hypothetical protein
LRQGSFLPKLIWPDVHGADAPSDKSELAGEGIVRGSDGLGPKGGEMIDTIELRLNHKQLRLTVDTQRTLLWMLKIQAY